MKNDEKNGFTLMEVCVSLAILAVGETALGRFLDGFNLLRSVERNQVRTVQAVAQSVESLVAEPPECRDTSFVLNGTDVALRAVPGIKPLVWVLVSAEAVHTVQLRRLVRCRKN